MTRRAGVRPEAGHRILRVRGPRRLRRQQASLSVWTPRSREQGAVLLSRGVGVAVARWSPPQGAPVGPGLPAGGPGPQTQGVAPTAGSAGCPRDRSETL